MPTPESFYREAIDLQKYSNFVADEIVTNYNNIILDLARKLQDEDNPVTPASQARIRAQLLQLKESLNTWQRNSSLYLVDELQGLALFQEEFVRNELQKVLPKNAPNVNTVQISDDFARSIVFNDPTELNILTLPKELEGAVQRKFSLTAAKGSAIVLPNGQVVEKAFRGISIASAERLTKEVNVAVAQGESLPALARKLRGKLRFGSLQKMTAKAQRLAAGDGMQLANNQVMTVVRTSVNQTQNAASMASYEANQNVTKRYKYVATLDAKTTKICGSLDGRMFKYGKGPMPPQHFNCRSTTVPIIDDEDLRRSFPDTRPSKTGRVPQDTSYPDWLKQNPSMQTKALGNKKNIFNYLINKKNKSPREALRLIIRDDGTELPLKVLKEKYKDAFR